ncbi:S26 family signal peptidase [Tistrella mobilis]|uniref:Peptidase S26, conserved region n=1 Tax=Tistrella mobilis (strain KA081020-065) TaxID=1110502 RepID=I3TMQ0_TISMK|nr:S26 family signal peptidase [Tistrella mobilis]AFK54038.1 Peptidase S26, conserved region [Tistrella mobilis KA081020-065]
MSEFKWKVLVTTYIAASVVALTAFIEPPPKLVWNASASVPVGLYAVQPLGQPKLTELVVVKPPEPLAAFLADGGYLGYGAPLLKRIAALPGQTICRDGAAVSIDGVVWTQARERDRLGRVLPSWSGCRQLRDGEVFLLNWNEPDSLDGRYFGALLTSSLIGRAVPVWTDEER